MKTALIVSYLILGFVSLRLISCQTGEPHPKDRSTEPSSRIELLLNDTVNFTHQNLDFDSDGLPDRIISSKFLLGDSLFILKRDKNQYTLSLAIESFSYGGLYVVDSILLDPNRSNGLILKTYFNGSGGTEQDYYLMYNKRKKSWMLDYTIVEVRSGNAEGQTFVKTCKIHQSIDLNETTQWYKMRDINEAYDRECKSISMQ